MYATLKQSVSMNDEIVSMCFDHNSNQLFFCYLYGGNHIYDLNYSQLPKHDNKYHSSFVPRNINSKTICMQPITHNIVICDKDEHIVQLINTESRVLLFEIGSKGQPGKGETNLYYPTDVGCDQWSRIFVCDYINHRIQVYNEYGRHLHEFGRKMFAINYFNNIHVHDHCKQVLVANRFSNQVHIWSHDNCSKPIFLSNMYLENNRALSICSNPYKYHEVIIASAHDIFVFDNRNNQCIKRINDQVHDYNYISKICMNEIDGTLLVADYITIKLLSLNK